MPAAEHVSRSSSTLLELRASRTPLEATGIPRLSVKREDLTHPVYGGNKVRKLVLLLREAKAKGARRVITLGATGSHHVLATALFAPSVGLAAAAALFPQEETPHVRAVRDAIRATSAEIVETGSRVAAFARAYAMARRGDVVLPAGGSTPTGVLGYVPCADEIVEDTAGALPDEVVVATGSAGTAVGLALGFARRGVPVRVRAVIVADPPWLVRANARVLALRTAKDLGEARAVLSRLVLDDAWMGPGYGIRTDAGRVAAASGVDLGLETDGTYTEKALACALERARHGRRVVYVHTLGHVAA